MTDRELMQMALEAVEYFYGGGQTRVNGLKLIEALRDRLAQPEPEPVAWLAYKDGFQEAYITSNPLGYTDEYKTLSLWAHPPEWVGLDDEEVGGLTVFSSGLHHVEVPILADLIRAVEYKLKEKNS